MEAKVINKKSVEQKKEGQLKAILYLLQTQLEEYSSEVDKSYALLKVGEKTHLTKNIESTIDDPFGSMAKMTSDIDEKLRAIINDFAISFFKYKRNIISNVYKSSTSLNNLHYSIVLKQDNFKNRNSVFEFFDTYDLQEISTKYPVYFQFTPIELVDKIKNKEVIIF